MKKWAQKALSNMEVTIIVIMGLKWKRLTGLGSVSGVSVLMRMLFEG